MKKKEQFKHIIMFTDSLILIASVTLLFAYLWDGYYNREMVFKPFVLKGTLLLTVLYAFIFVLFSMAFGSFKVGYSYPSGLIGSQVISLILTNAVAYLQISLIARGFLPIVPILILTAVDGLIGVVWSIASTYIYRKIFPARKMIVVYGKRDDGELVVKMSQRMDKYLICSSISCEENIETIKSKILEYEAVIICDVPLEKRAKLLKFTFENSVRTYISPKISDIIVRGADEFHMFDTPLLLQRNQGMSFEQLFIKRFFDIVLSIIGIIISSPFMLVIALLIKIYDGGPVFYCQNRFTNGRKVFKLIKFRSMVVDAEKDGIARLASEEDSRITPVGKFLRSCRLDELPQLFNILGGSMSFVGPRPERPEIAEQYEEVMPEFAYRLNVKAGLTGFAQVFGKYNTTPYDKLKLDLMYIERHSFALDFRIMLMTFKTMFVPDATEGIKDGETAMPKDTTDPDEDEKQ